MTCIECGKPIDKHGPWWQMQDGPMCEACHEVWLAANLLCLGCGGGCGSGSFCAKCSATMTDAEKFHVVRESRKSYPDLGRDLGRLVESKQAQYGDSVRRSARIFQILYPNGIRSDQYADVLMSVRVIDKLSRISQRGTDGQDLGGESPWKDIAGYGLLGWEKDDGENASRAGQEAEPQADPSPAQASQRGFQEAGRGGEEEASRG